LPTSEQEAKTLLNNIHVSKQAQVPVQEQVENWEEVVAWGYGGETDAWQDLFDGTDSTAA